jgi:hypothetical protein
MKKIVTLIVLCLVSIFSFSQIETVAGKKIKSVKVEVRGDAEKTPLEGVFFRLYYTTTLANGNRIGTEWQTQKSSDYIVEIDGAKSRSSRMSSNKGNLNDQWVCKKCSEGDKNTLTVRVKRKEDKNWLTTKTIKIICKKTAAEIEAEINSRELVFTDDQINEINEQFKTMDFEEQKDAARKFHQFDESKKKRIGMGFKGLDKSKGRILREILKESDQKQPLVDLEYWKYANEVKVVPSEKNLYTFKKSDTLSFSTGPSKNIAMLKEGNTFIQVKTYSTATPDKYGFVKNYGFSINVYDISSGKYIKKSSKNISTNFKEYSGISINQFKACPKGYILVNPDMYILFDKQFNVLAKKSNASKLKERLYLDVDQIGTSNKFAIFFGEPSHMEHTENNYFVYQEVLDLDAGKTFNAGVGRFVEQISKSSDCIENPAFSRVFSTSNSEYVVIYYEDGFSRLKKYKIENNSIKLVWKMQLNPLFTDIIRVKGNKIHIYTDNAKGENRDFSPSLAVYEMDLSGNTEKEASATIKKITTSSVYIVGGEYKYIYPQEDGSTVVLSKTPYKSLFKQTPIIQVYNSDFSLKGQFRIGMPLAAEAADYGYFITNEGAIETHESRGLQSGIKEDPYFNRPQHQSSGRKWRYNNRNGEYKFNTVSSGSSTGIKYRNDPDVLTNAVTFFDGHDTFEFIRDGETIYMLTPYAIVKLDMTHVVDAIPYDGAKKYYSHLLVFSRAYYEKK